MGSREHYEKRMLELCQLETIVEEPEWKHMKECEQCISEFVYIATEGSRPEA